MSYGPFDPWDEEDTYSTGDRVSFGGYIYEAMTSISAGDNPRTATYTLLSRTFRKWRVWDYPFAYQMARLRGLPDPAFEPGSAASAIPDQILLTQVRADYQYNGDPTADLYLVPSSMSSAGYGMPQGMDSNWATAPNNGEYVWSFSYAEYDDGEPKSYSFNAGTDDGIVFGPTTILPQARYDGSIPPSPATFWAFYPALATNTQGQLISCYQTFGRTFNWIDEVAAADTVTIPAFSDEFNEPGNGFTTNNENPIGDTIGTEPDYEDT